MFIYVLGDQCLLQRLYNIRYLHRVSLLYGLFSLKVTPSCKDFTTLVTFLGFSAVCVRLCKDSKIFKKFHHIKHTQPFATFCFLLCLWIWLTSESNTTWLVDIGFLTSMSSFMYLKILMHKALFTCSFHSVFLNCVSFYLLRDYCDL